jgi:hypothetical protein
MRSAKKGSDRMGRPRKSEPRRNQLNLSLTDKELKSIKLRAKAVGMRPVHFGRALILDRRRSPKFKSAREIPLNRLVLNQLARLGNNLNQLMRHLHSTGDPLPRDLEPLLKDIRDIIARRFPNDR